uniref:Uncharacterized protein n=1 Tax=Bos mutus grunniens TaxID=30521 RepID=A0A8B9Y9T6_BOSMU
MLLTHSSSFAVSVSSLQGLMSSKREDLATRAGILAFFDSCCARHSSLSLLASSLSPSSSDPKRSLSSPSLLSVEARETIEIWTMLGLRSHPVGFGPCGFQADE